jgi:hypothetical protein
MRLVREEEDEARRDELGCMCVGSLFSSRRFNWAHSCVGGKGVGDREGLGYHVLDRRLLCNGVNGCAAGGTVPVSLVCRATLLQRHFHLRLLTQPCLLVLIQECKDAHSGQEKDHEKSIEINS